MAYRVISNDAPRHLQFAVVRDDDKRGPIIVAGPFADERVARLHCDALNRTPPVKSDPRRPLYGFTIDRVVSILQSGWSLQVGPRIRKLCSIP